MLSVRTCPDHTQHLSCKRIGSATSSRTPNEFMFTSVLVTSRVRTCPDRSNNILPFIQHLTFKQQTLNTGTHLPAAGWDDTDITD